MWYDPRTVNRKYRLRYPDKGVACNTNAVKKWRTNNRTSYLKKRRKYYRTRWRYTRYEKLHGLSREQYEALLQKQEHKCAICAAKVPLDVDHDHQTGKVRGLLCRRCNMGIGFFNDAPDRIAKAAAYLASS
jgi:Fe-S oxidoreductase